MKKLHTCSAFHDVLGNGWLPLIGLALADNCKQFTGSQISAQAI